jgi:hypothetical protein
MRGLSQNIKSQIKVPISFFENPNLKDSFKGEEGLESPQHFWRNASRKAVPPERRESLHVEPSSHPWNFWEKDQIE